MIQPSKQRYSNMLWNIQSITMHKRSYGHPLHPDLTQDVLTCVLPLGTFSSGRESEVESAHLFLTIIQFFSACHLTQLNHITFTYTLRKSCGDGRVAKHLYMTFVDLTKAFDTVSRDGLWNIMAKFGCPPRYIASNGVAVS